MRLPAMLRPILLATTTMLLIAACSNDTPASGPVTIETAPDFSTRPVVGTFEVTDGADTLGCTNGTYEDAFDEATQDVTKLMTCDAPNTGTFSILFDPDGYETGPGEQNGPWSFVAGTGDFTGLEGQGDFWLIGDVETYSGDLEYSS